MDPFDNADPLNGPTTVASRSEKTFYFDLGQFTDSTYVSVLPDWMVFSAAGTPTAMINEVGVSAPEIYRLVVYHYKDGHSERYYQSFTRLSSHPDAILQQQYKDVPYSDSTFFYGDTVNFKGASTINQPPPPNGIDIDPAKLLTRIEYTGHYYLTFGLVGVDDAYAAAGITPSDRVLVAFGNPTGQRAAEWGNLWVNYIDTQPPVLVPPVDQSPLPAAAELQKLQETDGSLSVQSRPWSYDAAQDQWSLPGFGSLAAMSLGVLGKGRDAFVKGMADEATDEAVGFFAKLAARGNAAYSAAYTDLANAAGRVSQVRDLLHNGLSNIFGLAKEGADGLLDSNFDYQSWSRRVDDAFSRFQGSIDDAAVDQLSKPGIGAAKDWLSQTRFFTSHSNISAGLDMRAEASSAPVQLENGHDHSYIGGEEADSIRGGDGKDLVFGRAGNDRLSGSAGADTLVGGDGSDYADYSDSPSGVVVDLVTDIATGGFAQGDKLSGIEGLYGSAFDDQLTGTAGANGLVGGAGNDVLVGGGGADALVGDAGYDTAVFAGYFETYSLTMNSGFGQVGRDGVSNLGSVECVKFEDGSFVYDGNAAYAQILRAYDTVLGRRPDAVGLDFYVDAMEDRGVTLVGVANDLSGSSEFQAATGGLSNAQFVDYVFRHALGRIPDTGGLNYYTQALNSGMSRGAFVVSLSESVEHRTLTQAQVAQGYFNTDDTYQAVALLYDGFAGRLPDAGGLTYYAGRIKSGVMTLSQVAADFAGSAEFKAAIAGKTNAQIVDFIYLNTLDRAAEPGGRAFYTNQLNQGATAAGVLLDVALSQEHYNLYANHIVHGIDVI